MKRSICTVVNFAFHIDQTQLGTPPFLVSFVCRARCVQKEIAPSNIVLVLVQDIHVKVSIHVKHLANVILTWEVFVWCLIEDFTLSFRYENNDSSTWIISKPYLLEKKYFLSTRISKLTKRKSHGRFPSDIC